MFDLESKFLKLVKIIVFKGSPSQQNDWLLRGQHTLCATDKVNRHLSKKIQKTKKNEKKRSKSVKSLRYMDGFFFPTNESYQLYIIAKYEASNCCKIEAAIQRCS